MSCIKGLGLISPHGSQELSDWRPCGDYCQLKVITTSDRYPIPHIQDFPSALSGTQIFAKIDLIRGYHQILYILMTFAKLLFQLLLA